VVGSDGGMNSLQVSFENAGFETEKAKNLKMYAFKTHYLNIVIRLSKTFIHPFVQ
jgi:hypothetical protein